jgi:hypothetical protein
MDTTSALTMGQQLDKRYLTFTYISSLDTKGIKKILRVG